MKYYQRYIHLVIFFILISVVSITKEYNPFINNDLQNLPESLLHASKTEDILLKEIKEKSATYEEAPQNAYIDKVWKRTPGRNGIKVNIEESYKKMKKAGIFKEELIVYETVSPDVSLGDLSPAPIFRGHPKKEMVAFLINVSWGTEHVPDILNILKESNVKASFFLEGKWAKENANLVKMIDEQGHLIGNHAYNHPDMALISRQEMTEQINQTNKIIEAIIDKQPVWFAPPSGSFNQEVIEVVDEQNMETILWTVDTIDWKNPSVSVMINRVMNNVHPGATILMHPTASVVHGMPQMIEEIKNKGYKLATIETLLSEDR